MLGLASGLTLMSIILKDRHRFACRRTCYIFKAVAHAGFHRWRKVENVPSKASCTHLLQTYTVAVKKVKVSQCKNDRSHVVRNRLRTVECKGCGQLPVIFTQAHVSVHTITWVFTRLYIQTFIQFVSKWFRTVVLTLLSRRSAAILVRSSTKNCGLE